MAKNRDYIPTTHLYNITTDSNESEMFFNNLIWLTTKEASIYLRKSVNALLGTKITLVVSESRDAQKQRKYYTQTTLVNGFSAQHDQRVHFGIGKNNTIETDKIIIMPFFIKCLINYLFSSFHQIYKPYFHN